MQDSLAPVLSLMLRDITAALPARLHICLLQLLPNLVLRTGERPGQRGLSVPLHA
jgi:hypothetical protein